MLLGIKFREKGSKTYHSVIVQAPSIEEGEAKFWKEVVEDEGFDVDKRTISWAGNSIPLAHDNDVFVLYGVDLDGNT